MSIDPGSVPDRQRTGEGPVLDIDDLKVTFATDGGDVYAV